jgi:xanthine dehydrogenase accessory factor
VSSVFEDVAELVSQETPAVVATVLRPEAMLGRRVLAVAGALRGTLGDDVLDRAVLAQCQRLVREGQSRAVALQSDSGDDVEVFVDVYPAPATLYIFGGVHVAIPLTKFAKILGYRVSVIDPRGVFATRERFAEADELAIEHPDDYLQRVHFNENCAVVVLTHEPRYDEPVLKAALHTAAGYVGAIGSRATNRARIERLRAQGVSDDRLARIHSPIGLDIGSQVPEEIALAIIAEITAERYGKTGASLKERAGAVAAA